MKTELEKLTLTAELQGYRVIARADDQITLIDKHGVAVLFQTCVALKKFLRRAGD